LDNIINRFKSPTALFSLGIRILLGGVFIYSGCAKILDPAGFAQAIAAYQLVPTIWGNLMALFLPWLELVCGICLITGWIARTSALIVMVLLLIFMAAIGITLYRGLDIDCGCFGSSTGASGNMYIDLLRDGILMAMAAIVVFKNIRKGRHKPPAPAG